MGKNSDNLYLHADGDSFFVACELSVEPQYKGKPVVVGEDRGIAVAMSYEAKKLGVTRGMPVFQIKREYPEVIILPHHFDLYNKISEGVYNILISYLENVEVYSIDECFAIVKQSDIKYAGSAEVLVSSIKNEIENTLGVTYSFGLGRTKALAKTASKLNKPNGMVLLLNQKDEELALKKTMIDDIWGIGKQTIPRLHNMGMKTAYDFVSYPSEDIIKYFSLPLYILKLELKGQVYNEVKIDKDPRDQKSIQSTRTFKPSSNDPNIIFAELSENVERACEQARELDLATNSVSFFVKNKDFIHRTGESRLSLYTTDPSVILNIIEPIFYKTLQKGEDIRSTGITLHNLRREEEIQRDLFGIQEKDNEKNVLNKVGDKIREKFGPNILKRASSLRGSGKNRGNSFHKI
ncbi:DNA polymerase IV [Candidatus Nomurabacteria bacterium]|nr:DNA polymerase IV [Candidatus Nomurabacteria bacterium]